MKCSRTSIPPPDEQLSLLDPINAVPMTSSLNINKSVGNREARFFNGTRSLASQAKSKIVIDSFLGWAGVMLNQRPFALWYIDLYCGRGVYGDGTWSTPIELFDKISRDERLPGVLRILFNDHRKRSVLTLREHILAHPNYGAMASPPRFECGAVDEHTVAELRNRRPRVPTFAFIDPFGYKGLTQNLIDAVLQDYGCDVMFFFAYHPIKRVLNNPNDKLRGHVEALLGYDRVRSLRKHFNDGVPEMEMERLMIEALRDSMRAIGGCDVLTFAFRQRTGSATHHLAFVSKHVRGFQKAKEAMFHASSWFFDGNIPGLEFVEPGYDNALVRIDPPSIDKLALMLVLRSAGRRISVQEAYDTVTFGTPYVQRNVREALVRLVQVHGAKVFGGGQPSKLRGSRLPANATIEIPRSLRRVS